jgi:hypothetical protein
MDVFSFKCVTSPTTTVEDGIGANLYALRDPSQTSRSKVFAANSLKLLAAKNHCNADTIIEAGGLQELVLLLRQGSEDGKAQAASALKNLAANCKDDAHKVKIAEVGGIPALVDLVWNGSEAAQTNAAGALFTLTYNKANVEVVKIQTTEACTGRWYPGACRTGTEWQQEGGNTCSWGAIQLGLQRGQSGCHCCDWRHHRARGTGSAREREGAGECGGDAGAHGREQRCQPEGHRRGGWR